MTNEELRNRAYAVLLSIAEDKHGESTRNGTRIRIDAAREILSGLMINPEFTPLWQPGEIQNVNANTR